MFVLGLLWRQIIEQHNEPEAKKEFIAKIHIVLEEIDETLFWIELLIDSEIVKKSMLDLIRKEADELTAIFCSISKRTGNK